MIPVAVGVVFVGCQEPLPHSREGGLTEKALRTLDLNDEEGVEAFRELVEGGVPVRLYFGLHDVNARYSDFETLIIKTDSGYDYTLSGHGIGVNRYEVQDFDALLSRVARDNGRYNHSSKLFYEAFNDAAESGQGDRPEHY